MNDVFLFISLFDSRMIFCLSAILPYYWCVAILCCRSDDACQCYAVEAVYSRCKATELKSYTEHVKQGWYHHPL